MSSADDSLIISYLDGELDREEAARFESLVTKDPSLANRLVEFRLVAGMSKIAFNDVLNEPVPEHLVDTIKRSSTAPQWQSATAKRPANSNFRFQAVAACVVALIIGSIGGLTISQQSAKVAVAESEQRHLTHLAKVDSLLNETLETTRSGETVTWISNDGSYMVAIAPIQTYRNKRGEYCRAYTLTTEQSGYRTVSEGIACRSIEKTWIAPTMLQTVSSNNT